MEPEKLYKRQLIKHLLGGEAFMPLDDILKVMPYDRLGERPRGLPYSFYELFYHITFTQRDILNYCLKPDYSAPQWPQDYWPEEEKPKDPEAWNSLKSAFFEEREKLMKLLASGEFTLSNPVPSNKDHSYFREVLLVIEHTAYHTGQLLIILRLLGLK